MGDILKWFVLNTAIFIPFTCAFWIAFGLNSQNPADGYTDISSLLYNIFLMIIVGGYEWEELEKADSIMARLLCGSFILAAAVITLNLLIALVTHTFERHYQKAVANAVMQRARTILLIQSTMGKKKLQLYFNYIKSNASPQIIQKKYGRLMGNKSKDRANIERVYDDVQEIKSILAKRFREHYGKGTKSDLEIVREDLGRIKRSGKELAKDIKSLRLILYGLGVQPVPPVTVSVRSKIDNIEHSKDGKESASENRKPSNNDNSRSSKNITTTNKKSPVNEDTTNKPQSYSGNISNYKPVTLNERVSSAPVLHSQLGNITIPKLGKSPRKKNCGRRSSKKVETSTSDTSESDGEFEASSRATSLGKKNSRQWKEIYEKNKEGFRKYEKPNHGANEKWWKGEQKKNFKRKVYSFFIFFKNYTKSGQKTYFG